MEDDEKLYRHAYRKILCDIFNEVYPYHSKLPTISELCSIYHVGRNTIRSALLALQEDGYVTMQRGTQTTVIFNHHNQQLQLQYKQALFDLHNVTKDIFKTMELIFPHIGTIALKKASPEQIKQLYHQIDEFDIENIKHESQLVKQLFGLYETGFSFLNNPILNSLISNLLYTMFYPNSLDESISKIKKTSRHMKTSLKIMIKLSQKKNNTIVKHMIAGLCHEYGKSIDKNIEESCKGMKVNNEKQFIWNIHQEDDYLYMKVVSGIIADINKKIYKNKALLPSISELSKLYNVSDRTTRRALKVLRDYGVIKTRNGVGSQVNITVFSNRLKLLKNKELENKVKEYFYSVEIIIMINQVIIPYVFKAMSKSELKAFIQKLRGQECFTLTYFYDAIYRQTNQCLYTIYKELEKYKMWGVFVNLLGNTTVYDFSNIKDLIIHALEAGDIHYICIKTSEIMKESLY